MRGACPGPSPGGDSSKSRGAWGDGGPEINPRFAIGFGGNPGAEGTREPGSRGREWVLGGDPTQSEGVLCHCQPPMLGEEVAPRGMFSSQQGLKNPQNYSQKGQLQAGALSGVTPARPAHPSPEGPGASEQGGK